MTLAALEAKNPRYAEAFRLCRIQRLSFDAAAKRLGIRRNSVRDHVARAVALLGPDCKAGKGAGGHAEAAAHDAELSRFGRCKRCQLLWPCVCLPKSAAEYALDRPGAGDVYPEGGP